MKRKYSIDLAGHMAECEANYLRLTKLLPQMPDIDLREFDVEMAGGATRRFSLRVTERCKYTTMLEISQLAQPAKVKVTDPVVAMAAVGDRASADQNAHCETKEAEALSSVQATISQLVRAPTFAIRIYHDAQMAEVISYDRHHPLNATYDYPNNNMYQSDEKAQLNKFLGEWLSHCLQYGRVLDGSANSVYC